MSLESTLRNVARHASAAEPAWLRVLRQQLSQLDYGRVQIVVHDGRVQQIDVTERTRVSDQGRRAPAAL